MHTRTTGWLTVAVLATTTLWAALVIPRAATAPPAESLDAFVSALDTRKVMFTLNYANAALITLLNVGLFSAFYVMLRQREPVWAAIGWALVPAYGLANLIAYLSQIFVVPGLVAGTRSPAAPESAALLLALALHEWPGSAVGALNALAYALLGVTQIIYGALFVQHGGRLRLPGWLLGISGGLSVLGLIGLGVGSTLLGMGTLVSGAVFLVALVPLAIAFLRASGHADA